MKNLAASCEEPLTWRSQSSIQKKSQRCSLTPQQATGNRACELGKANALTGFIHSTLPIRAIIRRTERKEGIFLILRLENLSGDTLEMENLVPLGRSIRRPHITEYRSPGLTRATLFRPGHAPSGLIVPDNSWEMGFSAIELQGGDLPYLCQIM